MLRGAQKSDMEWIAGKKLQKSLHKSAQIFALQIHPVSASASLCDVDNPNPEVQQLLSEYTDISVEPKACLLYTSDAADE